MSLAERSYGNLWYRRIRCGGYVLLVEQRASYTSYRIESVYTGRTVLWHDIRELDEWWEKDKARREAIRQAVKERGLGRFAGRYNR